MAADANEALGNYRFDEAAGAIYHFAWHELCDWYLEMIKPALFSGEDTAAQAARAVLGHVLDRVLLMLHPFMPFITEELWQSLPHAAGTPPKPRSIALAAFPVGEPDLHDPVAEEAMRMVMENVTVRRNLTAGKGPLEATDVPTRIRPLTPVAREVLSRHRATIATLCRFAGGVEISDETMVPDGLVALSGVTSSSGIMVFLRGGQELESERARLNREIEKLLKDLAVHEAKLGNDGFLSRAKPEAVDKVRAAFKEVTGRIARLRETLEQLAAQ